MMFLAVKQNSTKSRKTPNTFLFFPLGPRPVSHRQKKKNTFYAGVASTGSPQRRCVRWQVSIDQQRRCAPEAATKPQQPRLEKVEGKGSYFCSINPFLKHYEIDEFVWS